MKLRAAVFFLIWAFSVDCGALVVDSELSGEFHTLLGECGLHVATISKISMVDRVDDANGRAYLNYVGTPFEECHIDIARWAWDLRSSQSRRRLLVHEILHCSGFKHVDGPEGDWMLASSPSDQDYVAKYWEANKAKYCLQEKYE